MINKFEHLFSKGEYPARDKLLSGLTFEQVTEIPPGLSHSIYEELWHLTQWQDVVTGNDEKKLKDWESENTFPLEKPKSIEEWEELVDKFNNGVKRIFDFTSDEANLKIEIEPGFTINDTLSCLAVHNAVHFGKILAIRQMIGAWPPSEDNKPGISNYQFLKS
jgi:uncharacterized damage-inducible protein DinB